MVSFRRLLTPIQVGPLYLANRMVRTPMQSNLAGVNGEVSQQLLDMYEHCARQGVGLIIVESTEVDGRHWPHNALRIDHERFEPGLRRLVEIIHDNDVPVIVQLRHYGMLGNDPVSPSGIACKGFARKNYISSRAMSLDEVEEARELFIAAAVRTRNVGFDGVLLHGVTSFLLQQFVSPHTNKRTDRYGGSFENRCALSLEIVRGIRRTCGETFALGYSLIADELLPDGITLEESTAFARMLQQEGVNFIDVRIGSYETILSDPRGGAVYRQGTGMLYLSEAFKKTLSIPVFDVIRGEHDPATWEEAIAAGRCDVVQIGRPLLADPELPRKLALGHPEDVRLCIKCGYCNERLSGRGWQVGCAINPEWGRERDFALKRTENPKRILVVGGGPAGMEFARVSALRGHTVTLVEKEKKPGGNLRVASYPPRKEIFQTHFGDWLECQCKKANVRLETGKEVTVDVIKEYKPDVVILATGATPFVPALPGVDRKHVVLAADVLSGKVSVGKRVVVAGGGEVGVETADCIIDKGLATDVIMIEMLPQIGSDMYGATRTYLVDVVLAGAGVKMVTGMRIDEITDDGVVATDKDGKRHSFKADTVVLAMGYVANTHLYDAIKGKVPECYRIGDCVRARQIPDAVREAAYIARMV
jgi:2,4-dienoyl-CoA reductase-like NADH-dependent reductase (Old Yellow Enzyme family)/thioredoxin reductase